MSVYSSVHSVLKSLDASKSEHAKTFLSLALENRKEADRRYHASAYSFLFVGLLYYLFTSGAVQEATFFSIKLDRIDLVLWLLPVLMSFSLYTAVHAFFAENHLRELSHAYWASCLPEFCSCNLHCLADHPSFLNLERLASHSSTLPGKIATSFGIIVVFGMLLLGHGVVIYAVFNNWENWASGVSPIASVGCTLITALFLLRTIALSTDGIINETR